MSNLKDYATSTIAVAPSPADSGTSLQVESGHGGRFPATPFYVTVHPPSEFPTLDNAEKLEVTARTDDTLTVLRAQGSTTAKSIEAGWRISNSLFLADIPVVDSTAVNTAGAVMESDTSTASMSFVVDEDDMSSNSSTKLATQQSIKAYVDTAISTAKQALMPVGTIVVLGVSTNPNTLYGFGTWSAITDRVIVGKGSTGTFNTLNATGGTEAVRQGFIETPANSGKFQDPGENYLLSAASDLDDWLTGGGSSTVTHAKTVRSLGGTVRTSGTTATEVRHGRYTSSTLQPYIVKYIWQRTA